MLAQRLPANMEEKVITFHRFVIQCCRKANYQIGRILNMDENPMRLVLPATRLKFTGTRTVPIKTCGTDKQSFTVALTVRADGTKFPPKVIFIGVRFPTDLEAPPQTQVSVHRKGWMDEEGD